MYPTYDYIVSGTLFKETFENRAPNSTIIFRNTRSGAILTATTDQFGYYEINLKHFEDRWKDGDVILIKSSQNGLRAEKTFDFPGDVRLHIIGDFFNVFNNQIDLASYNRMNSSNHALISEVMQGFTFRLGLRLVLR